MLRNNWEACARARFLVGSPSTSLCTRLRQVAETCNFCAKEVPDSIAPFMPLLRELQLAGQGERSRVIKTRQLPHTGWMQHRNIGELRPVPLAPRNGTMFEMQTKFPRVSKCCCPTLPWTIEWAVRRDEANSLLGQLGDPVFGRKKFAHPSCPLSFSASVQMRIQHGRVLFSRRNKCRRWTFRRVCEFVCMGVRLCLPLVLEHVKSKCKMDEHNFKRNVKGGRGSFWSASEKVFNNLSIACPSTMESTVCRQCWCWRCLCKMRK